MGKTNILLDFFIFILWLGIAFTFNSYKILVGRQGAPQRYPCPNLGSFEYMLCDRVKQNKLGCKQISVVNQLILK